MLGKKLLRTFYVSTSSSESLSLRKHVRLALFLFACKGGGEPCDVRTRSAGLASCSVLPFVVAPLVFDATRIIPSIKEPALFSEHLNTALVDCIPRPRFGLRFPFSTAD